MYLHLFPASLFMAGVRFPGHATQVCKASRLLKIANVWACYRRRERRDFSILVYDLALDWTQLKMLKVDISTLFNVSFFDVQITLFKACFTVGELIGHGTFGKAWIHAALIKLHVSFSLVAHHTEPMAACHGFMVSFRSTWVAQICVAHCPSCVLLFSSIEGWLVAFCLILQVYACESGSNLCVARSKGFRMKGLMTWAFIRVPLRLAKDNKQDNKHAHVPGEFYPTQFTCNWINC